MDWPVLAIDGTVLALLPVHRAATAVACDGVEEWLQEV